MSLQNFLLILKIYGLSVGKIEKKYSESKKEGSGMADWFAYWL